MRALSVLLVAASCGGDDFVWISFPGEGAVEVVAVERASGVSVHVAAVEDVVRFPVELAPNEEARIEAAFYAESDLPLGPLALREDGAPLAEPDDVFVLNLPGDGDAWTPAAWPSAALGAVRIDPGCRTVEIAARFDLPAPLADAIAFDDTAALAVAFDQRNRFFLVDAAGPMEVETSTQPEHPVLAMALHADLWIGEANGGLWRSDPRFPLDFGAKHLLGPDDAVRALDVSPRLQPVEVFLGTERGVSKFTNMLAPLADFTGAGTARTITWIGTDATIASAGVEVLRYEAGAVERTTVSSVPLDAARVAGRVLAGTESGEIVQLPGGAIVKASDGVAIQALQPFAGGFVTGDDRGALTEYLDESPCASQPIFDDDVVKRIVPVAGGLLLFGRTRVAHVTFTPEL